MPKRELTSLQIAALIERLEKASGPDRDIDWAIVNLLGLVPQPPLEYTSSIDAALTLVPDDAKYLKLERYSDGFYAAVSSRSDSTMQFQGTQKPAAIALCIAALKARAALPDISMADPPFAVPPDKRGRV